MPNISINIPKYFTGITAHTHIIISIIIFHYNFLPTLKMFEQNFLAQSDHVNAALLAGRKVDITPSPLEQFMFNAFPS